MLHLTANFFWHSYRYGSGTSALSSQRNTPQKSVNTPAMAIGAGCQSLSVLKSRQHADEDLIFIYVGHREYCILRPFAGATGQGTRKLSRIALSLELTFLVHQNSVFANITLLSRAVRSFSRTSATCGPKEQQLPHCPSWHHKQLGSAERSPICEHKQCQ